MIQKIFFIGLLSLLTCYSGMTQSKKTIQFLDSYEKVGFWNVQGNVRPLLKWSNTLDTITYKIEGDQPYLNQKLWKSYLDDLQQLTGKALVESSNEDYHILMFFGELSQYAKYSTSALPSNNLSSFNSWSSRSWNGDFNLTRASFCLVPRKIDSTPKGIYYLKNMMLKSMGLLGESEDEYSIFFKYFASSNNKLSRNDKRLIKLHYNESIESGLSQKSVRKILSNLPDIDELAVEKLK